MRQQEVTQTSGKLGFWYQFSSAAGGKHVRQHSLWFVGILCFIVDFSVFSFIYQTDKCLFPTYWLQLHTMHTWEPYQSSHLTLGKKANKAKMSKPFSSLSSSGCSYMDTEKRMSYYHIYGIYIYLFIVDSHRNKRLLAHFHTGEVIFLHPSWWKMGLSVGTGVGNLHLGTKEKRHCYSTSRALAQV